jgi:hypothetical protein
MCIKCEPKMSGSGLGRVKTPGRALMIATSGCGDDYAVIAAIRDARLSQASST